MTAARNGLIAALDVGSTKICCFIAKVEDGRPRVIGQGHGQSRGMRGGTVVDIEEAERAIRTVVEQAERVAGETIKDVFLTTNAGEPQSHHVDVEVQIGGAEIGDADIRRGLAQGRAIQLPADRTVLHSIPVNFTADGSVPLRNPRGLFAEKLTLHMHSISGRTSPLRNLAHCVQRAMLNPVGIVVAPFAAGLACLVEDEIGLGSTVIDCGGGTTSIAVFYQGALVYSDVVPIGGVHITNDIARGLSTAVSDAERLKSLHGTCLQGHHDDETIPVPQVGEADDQRVEQVPKSLLNGIIRPRVEEILELVRERVSKSGFERQAGRRVVLTGGASQLQGFREMSARVLDKQVRIGRPIGIAGLADAMGGPAFAASAGLLVYALKERAEAPTTEPARRGGLKAMFDPRTWLRATS